MSTSPEFFLEIFTFDFSLENDIIFFICDLLKHEAQEGSPPSGHKVTVFQGPRSPGHFFPGTQVVRSQQGRFFKLSRSRGHPQNGPRSQVAKTPSWASYIALSLPKVIPIIYHPLNRAEIAKSAKVTGPGMYVVQKNFTFDFIPENDICDLPKHCSVPPYVYSCHMPPLHLKIKFAKICQIDRSGWYPDNSPTDISSTDSSPTDNSPTDNSPTDIPSKSPRRTFRQPYIFFK